MMASKSGSLMWPSVSFGPRVPDFVFSVEQTAETKLASRLLDGLDGVFSNIVGNVLSSDELHLVVDMCDQGVVPAPFPCLSGSILAK